MEVAGPLGTPLGLAQRLGHRRIAFLGGSMHSKDTSRRGVGFLEQLRLMDLPDDTGPCGIASFCFSLHVRVTETSPSLACLETVCPALPRTPLREARGRDHKQ